MTAPTPIIDQFGRIHTSLRVSVTDRCNIRCFYCMPDENIRFRPRSELLTFEEITRFVSVVAQMGVNKVRLTGGEPLVRTGIAKLISKLVTISGVMDVAMTTNGILLEDHARELKEAGLSRLNVSLDAMSEGTFRQISRRDGLSQVIAGILAAKRVGFEKVRLNAVAIRGITESEIVPLAEFARDHEFELRFIEFMPLDAEKNWNSDQVITGQQIRKRLEEAFGSLVAVERRDLSQPAIDFAFADGRGRIGFINPITQPFCGDCNRLRITAEGKLRNCLFSSDEWDVRNSLRSNAADSAIAQIVRDCVSAKKPGHGIDTQGFTRPERAMYQIGG